MPRVMVELQNNLGQRIRFVRVCDAQRMVARGVAFHASARVVRLADRRHVGSGLDRGTPPTISAAQLRAATDAWWNERRAARLDPGEMTAGAVYQARRIAAWGEVHDRRAPLAGSRA